MSQNIQDLVCQTEIIGIYKWKGAFFLLKMSQQSVDTGSVPYQTWCHITWLTAPKEKQNPKKANIQYSNYSAGYVEFSTTYVAIASVPINIIYSTSTEAIKDPQTMDRPRGIFPQKIESNTTLLRLVC